MSNLSVIQLERMLERKRTRLASLLKKRDRLQKQLTNVEGRISEIGGAPTTGAPNRRSRKRPQNDRPLKTVVMEVLTKHNQGLALKDLAAKVLESGYKSSSVKFETAVYQCLYNHTKDFRHDAKTRTYSLPPNRTSVKKTTADSKPEQAG